MALPVHAPLMPKLSASYIDLITISYKVVGFLGQAGLSSWDDPSETVPKAYPPHSS